MKDKLITDPELQELDVVSQIEERATELDNTFDYTPTPPQWQAPDLTEDEGPTTGETFEAAFAEENLIGSTISYYDDKAGFGDFEDQLDYNVYDEDLTGYEDYLDEFGGVRSEKEMKFVKKRIDTGRENRKIIAESGAMGIGAMLTVGILDPTIFIPVAGTVYKASKTATVLANAARTSASVGAVEAGREFVLHEQQPVRTIEESALNIGGAMVLSGILGGAASFLSTKKYDDLVDDMDVYIDEHIKPEQKMETPFEEPTGDVPLTVKQSDGAEATPIDLEAVFNKIDEAVWKSDDLNAADATAQAIQTGSVAVDKTGVGATRVINEELQAERAVRAAREITETPEVVPFEVPEIRAEGDIGEDAGAALTKDMKIDPSEPTHASESLVGGKAMEAMTVGPSGRLAQSKSLQGKIIGQQLVEDPWLRIKHKFGIASEESWETMVKRRDVDLDDVVRMMDNRWKAYSARVAKVERAFKNQQEFNEAVSGAMRRGDTHNVSEVDSVAKYYRKKYERIKDELIAARLLPEDTTVMGALSYLPRSYNKELIIANHNEFRAGLEAQLAHNFTEDDILEITKRGISHQKYADEYAEEIINNILGATDNGNATKNVFSSPLKARKLNLSDEFLEQWLESDAIGLYKNYHRQMLPQILFEKKFGGRTIDDLTDDIRLDYDEIKRITPDGKKQAKLIKQQKRDQADVQAMYDRMLNIRDSGMNKAGWASRTLATVRKYNAMRMLGGVWLTSLADIGRPIVVNGLGRYSGMVYQLAKNPTFAKLKMADMRRLAAATEITDATTSRIAKMADIGDDFQGGTAVERGMDWMSSKTQKAFVLPYHNSVMKSMVGLLTEDKILRFASSINAGKKVSVKEIQKLARIGIDADTAKLIAKQYDEFGETVDGLTLANFGDWTDPIARDAIEAAIAKMADETINTPGMGTLPLFFDNGVAKSVFQFKTFLVASHNQTLLAGLQQADGAFVTSMVAMVGMGAMISELKDKIAGRERSKTPQELLVEGVDRSGVLSLPMEINNFMDKQSGQRISLNALVGGNEAKRYASRNKLEAWVGPTAGSVGDIGMALELMGGKDLRKSDVHRMRKMLPLQNLFYTRQIFDELEKGLTDTLGVRK